MGGTLLVSVLLSGGEVGVSGFLDGNGAVLNSLTIVSGGEVDLESLDLGGAAATSSTIEAGGTLSTGAFVLDGFGPTTFTVDGVGASRDSSGIALIGENADAKATVSDGAVASLVDGFEISFFRTSGTLPLRPEARSTRTIRWINPRGLPISMETPAIPAP